MFNKRAQGPCIAHLSPGTWPAAKGISSIDISSFALVAMLFNWAEFLLNYFELGPVVQEERSFKDISYL